MTEAEREFDRPARGVLAESPECPPLVLGVKTGLYRMHDSAAEDADEAFCRVRHSVFLRDGGVCQGCQTKTVKPVKTVGGTSRGMGRFEVHHIDDDHHNNNPSNLILLCPFCHNVFHCGNAGHRNAGTIIEAPWITQADLNALVHALFRVMMLPFQPKRKNGTTPPGTPAYSDQEMETIKRMSQEAERRYQSLVSLSDGIESRFGRGMSDPAMLGKALMQLHKEDPARYAQREKFLGGARFLPSYAYFSTPPTYSSLAMSDIEYWKGVQQASDALDMHRIYDEWMHHARRIAGIDQP